MPNIVFEDFEKLDFRTGTVLEASDHPNADKLLVLKVAIGDDIRQIVAGIRTHYKAEDMVNKQIIVVVNLEPRKLRGVESHGMLLAVRDDENDRLALVTVDKQMRTGLKAG